MLSAALALTLAVGGCGSNKNAAPAAPAEPAPASEAPAEEAPEAPVEEVPEEIDINENHRAACWINIRDIAMSQEGGTEHE